MDREALPAVLGVLASVLTVLLVLVPYAVPGIGPNGVQEYYNFGVQGGWSVLVLAAVSAVVFAAAAAGRADGPTAAGAALVLGLATAVLAALWFVDLPYAVVTQLQTQATFVYHRWALLAAAASVPVFGVWLTAEQHLF